MSFSDRLNELDRRVASSVDASLREAMREVSDLIRDGAEEIARSARGSSLEQLRRAVSALDEATGQADLLQRLLEEAGRFASRTMLLLTSEEGARGWAAYGFGDDATSVEELARSYEGILAELADMTGCTRLDAAGRAELASHLGARVAAEAIFVPLVLRDSLAAVLYADRIDEDGGLDVAALQILVYTASHLLEQIPARGLPRTPTLTMESDDLTPLPLWRPAVETVEVGRTAAEEAEREPGEEEAIDAVTVSEEEWEVEDETADEELGVAAAEPAAASPVGLTEEEPPPPGEVELEAEPVPEPPEPVVDDAERPAEPSEPAVAAPDDERDEDDLGDDMAVSTESEAGSAAPVSDVARRPSADSTEVAPPSDIDAGPGLAFQEEAATAPVPTRDREATEMHEEARRLARLLISEIKLYNEEDVEAGRENSDLYRRLEDDIDRSRQMYEQRIDPRVREETDYFRQELVATLAGGDEEALGMEG